MKPQLAKEIVFIYFAGNATILQKKLIEEWLDDPDNAETYFEWIQEWEMSRPQFLADVGAAFENMKHRIDAGEPDEPDSEPAATVAASYRKRFMNSWRWAAVLLISAGMSGYVFRDGLLYQSYRTGYAQTRTLLLKDSSTVVLNPNSELKLLRWGFGIFGREVFLDGEAGFVVRHKVDHQSFIVHTADNGKVTVLGTEFFVYTRKKDTRVVLNKGKVQISSQHFKKPLDMKPGEKASINAEGVIAIKPLTKIELADPAVWKEHQFRFDQTSLAEATGQLRDVFGVNIVVKDPVLSEKQITGTFKAREAEELLTVFSEMLDMSVQVRQENVYLTPNP
jgi:transmembrane sensor